MPIKPFIIATLLILGGCTTTTEHTSFLVLETPQTFPESGIQPHPDLSIGLGPIRLPDMLDRPQVVTRLDSNRVKLADFHHWAGGLENNIYRVLQENLMMLLDTDRVTPYPWPRYRKLHYQVGLDVLRFDGTPGQRVRLSGLWNLLDGEGRKEYLVERFDIVEETETATYAALAAAQSRALGQLAQRIAAGIENHLSINPATK
ncbi:MAG TPA: membrane integrity-associated transporter subunit PqiC [Chromatiales bacterium]|nr:membrane integrity-associated transporter subunit PqiC [Chromatiales bacterium]